MAGISKRADGVWRITVYVGTDRDGKKKYRSRNIKAPHDRDGRRTAQQAAVEFEHECIRAGLLVPSGTDTLDDLVQRWIAHKSTSWSATHTSTTRQRWGKHGGRFAVMDPARITAADVDDYHRRLADAGVSTASRQRIHAVISGALTHATGQGIIARNPAAGRRPSKDRTTRHDTTPTVTQMRSAWECRDPWWGSVLRVVITTGMRRGEQCALLWSDLTGDQLTIRRAVSVVDRQTILGPPKSGRTRTITISPATLEVLNTHRQQQVNIWGEEHLGWIWHRRHDPSKPMPPASVTNWWSKHRTELGCADVRWHDWRHWCAVQMLGAGVDVHTAAHRLGHDPAVFLRTYAHAIPARDRRAADGFDDLL